MSLVVAGAALCAEIVLGVKGVDTYRVDDGGYRRAVEIGAELYAGGELAALGRVLKQARAAPPGLGFASDGAPSVGGDAPALLFLQALRASADVASRRGVVVPGSTSDDDDATEEALGLFFRAASGIDPGGGDESTGGDVSGDRVATFRWTGTTKAKARARVTRRHWTPHRAPTRCCSTW